VAHNIGVGIGERLERLVKAARVRLDLRSEADGATWNQGEEVEMR
jgi:hypothetical protein